MGNNVTDRVILKEIYDAYYRDFSSFDIENPPRESKIYVPIDCHVIAKKLNIDADIVFGRLYYHLDKKHGYIQADGKHVHLFAHSIGKDKHAVHFPLLSAVLAEHDQSFYRFIIPLLISTLALVVSIFAIYQTALNK